MPRDASRIDKADGSDSMTTRADEVRPNTSRASSCASRGSGAGSAAAAPSPCGCGAGAGADNRIRENSGLELLTRNGAGRAHVYAASQSEEQGQGRLVTDLLDRAFGGSALRLVVQALSTKPATPEELEEIKRLLDDMNGGAQ